MVWVVNKEPHKSVVKEAICRNCGVTLNYVPADVRVKEVRDYLGDSERYKVIECPACHHEVHV